MQRNEELIKQLKFIADICPRVFMNTPLDLAIGEIKQLIAKAENPKPISAVPISNLCHICKKNKFSYLYTYADKYVCADCYYDAFGDLIEQHPIGKA